MNNKIIKLTTDSKITISLQGGFAATPGLWQDKTVNLKSLSPHQKQLFIQTIEQSFSDSMPLSSYPDQHYYLLCIATGNEAYHFTFPELDTPEIITQIWDASKKGG
ncbi:protealysin inhibitor emfourin [Photorhabdus tasmaniensis]|uniref:protealysin inhibitor emfourin n=1 Tax=Photorhabdus tasmaniensis TaxID=1004159 RepID=UPI0040437ADA